MKVARWAALVSAAALILTSAAACEKGAVPDGAGDGCGSCAEAFANGTIPCGDTGSAEAWDTLIACACEACLVECKGSLCSALPSDGTCGDCLEEKCKDEHLACAER